MSTEAEQMWERFADAHGLEVNDAGRPFFVDGVMTARTPADDAGEADYWAVREIVRRGRGWARVTEMAAENDARALVAELRDEARAEADRLRAEVEELRDDIDGRIYLQRRTRAEADDDIDRLRATLGAVRSSLLQGGQSHAFRCTDAIRALDAADPVSLADVRENGCDRCGKPATRVTTPGGFRGCDDHFNRAGE